MFFSGNAPVKHVEGNPLPIILTRFFHPFVRKKLCKILHKKVASLGCRGFYRLQLQNDMQRQSSINRMRKYILRRLVTLKHQTGLHILLFYQHQNNPSRTPRQKCSHLTPFGVRGFIRSCESASSLPRLSFCTLFWHS